MNENTERFFVVTGGPGSGKSTLIDALERAGHARSVEAGRGVIQDQVAIGGRALPWADPVAFAELMLCREMRSYRIAQHRTGFVFFDRGMPDVVGYLRLLGLPVPEHAMKAAGTFRYNRRVFIAPPWEEIFQPDPERKQTFAQSVRTYDSMVETYTGLDYELVGIPRVSVEQRVRFVLHSVGSATRA